MEDKQLMEEVVRILDSKKADDMRDIWIGDLTILADYFVIAAGNSNTQVKMLADEVEYQLSQKGVKPHSTEGYRSENWIVLDYSTVVIHIFLRETREFYNLERLWAEGEQVDISHLLKQN